MLPSLLFFSAPAYAFKKIADIPRITVFHKALYILGYLSSICSRLIKSAKNVFDLSGIDSAHSLSPEHFSTWQGAEIDETGVDVTA